MADVPEGYGEEESGRSDVPVPGEDCDENVALFPYRTPPHESFRESRRATFTMYRSPGQSAHRVLRHQAAQAGWDHRIEVRDDTLTRRSLGWRGSGWRLVAGDLSDPALPLWPRQLPRRTLPYGWKPARDESGEADKPGAPLGLAAHVPQGLGAAIVQPGWRAHALRTWNPVETGREPPWRKPWDLRHFAAGASIDLPWTASLHLTETRAGREGTDTLSERMVAIGLAPPKENLSLLAARAASDARPGRDGWMLALDVRHRLDHRTPDGARDNVRDNVRGLVLTGTLRLRDADWASSWDPAVTTSGLAELGGGGDNGDGPETGAGEARLEARLPFYETIPTTDMRKKRRPRETGFASTEVWRVWNPPAGTGRQGVRGTFGWSLEDAKLRVTATHRTSRAASGSVSLYHYIEAETRVNTFPRWRLAAWRAWNHEGPLRAGLFAGAEPEWGNLRLSPGFRIEAKENKGEDILTGLALLGLRWRWGSGWKLHATASIPCLPACSTEETRWRAVLEHGGR